MWKAALAELVATAFLMFTLTTSIISSLDSPEAAPKLLVPFAVFINAFLFLLLTIPLTGGHMNPILTFIATLKGMITPVRAIIYLWAQCIGSIGGFLVLRDVMSHDVADKYSLGGCSLGGISPVTALVLEFSCTFLVLLLGVTIGFDKRRFEELGLPMVCALLATAMALSVFVSITVTGRSDYAGVGLNPARCLGTALLRGGHLWKGHWVFWLGPFLACIVYHCFTLTLPKHGPWKLHKEEGFLIS